MTDVISEKPLSDVASAVSIGDPNAAQFRDALWSLLTRSMDQQLIVGPHVPAIQFEQLLELTSKHNRFLRDKKVIDFGCGAHRPLSGAMLYYLCGAKQVTALDIEAMFDIGSVAIGLISEALSVIFESGKFDFARAGADKQAVLERIARLDMAALLKGDLRKGLPDSIQWRSSYYEKLLPSEKKFDVLISNTVFEHIADLSGTLSILRENISADGFMVIVIDYKDHRIYSGAAQSYFEYLMDGSDHLPGYINKVRHSNFLKIAASAGFVVEECVLETTFPSQAERARFLPQYAGLSDLDVSTCGARILFRPG